MPGSGRIIRGATKPGMVVPFGDPAAILNIQQMSQGQASALFFPGPWL